MENYKNTLSEIREMREMRRSTFLDHRTPTSHKEKYYVFLDIDGTLWDQKFALKHYGSYVNYVTEPMLKPESIEAINLLLRSLEQDYIPMLVITSQRRKNLPECIRYLQDNGLECKRSIYALKYPVEVSRGNNIVDFMEEHGEPKQKYRTIQNGFAKFLYKFGNADFERYVVIEDEKKLIQEEIPSNRTIMSNHDKKSITPSQVKSYLKRNGITPVQKEEKNGFGIY